MNKVDHFEELLDRVRKTASSRLFAHERLKIHVTISLWTISFFSMGLIFTPLAQVYNFKLNYSDDYIGFMQVVFAIVILAVSNILSMSNFSVRADRMHDCGMSLNALARKIEGAMNDKAIDSYVELSDKYEALLQRHENHAFIDYLYTKNRSSNSKLFALYIRLRFLVGFLPYIFILGIEAIWFYCLMFVSS